MNRIKEKAKMPIDSNNINTVSMKEIRVDRKNLNMRLLRELRVFSRSQVSWGQLEKVAPINFSVIKQKNRTVVRF